MRFAMSLACSFTLYYQFVDTYTRKPPKLVDSLMCKLISGAALVALTMATPTFAADLAVKAAGPVVPVLFSFLVSTTARLGYSFADRWLIFARGGGAWTREKIDDAFINAAGIAVDPSAKATRTGWTVGAGAEWAFASHWSATLEYNFYDFGNAGTLLRDGATTVTIFSLKDTIHAATAGVNYRF